jgi:hypothetical protein
MGIVGKEWLQKMHTLPSNPALPPILLEPLGNLGVVDRYGSAALTGFECLRDVFAQHPRDGITMMSGEFRNLDIGPAFLFPESSIATVRTNSDAPPTYSKGYSILLYYWS